MASKDWPSQPDLPTVEIEKLLEKVLNLSSLVWARKEIVLQNVVKYCLNKKTKKAMQIKN